MDCLNLMEQSDLGLRCVPRAVCLKIWKTMVTCQWYDFLEFLSSNSEFISATSWENLSSGFPTRSDTNLAVQPQKMATGLKFQIKIN